MPTRKFLAPEGRFAIAVRQDETTHKTTLHVFDGAEEFFKIGCVHAVINASLEQVSDAESVDDVLHLAAEGHVGIEPAKQLVIADEDLFWAHCSNIEYWLESGMPPQGLASNLSVPLLQALAKRDARLGTTLAFTLEDLVSKAPVNRQAILVERYGALLPGAWWSDHQEFIPSAPVEVLLAPASDPGSSPEFLRALANHLDPRVRAAVAMNRHLPEDVAQVLSKDSFLNVRYTLARNPVTPPATLLEFAGYRHILMRTCVAQNPSTPLEALRLVWQNSGLNLQQLVVENPQCTTAFLEDILASDAPDIVKDVARRRITLHPNKQGKISD